MAVIGKPNPQPTTPLFSVGWWLGSFANRLNDLGNRIDDVFIIGQYLASPFKTMAYIIGIAENKTYDADEYLSNVWTWLSGIIEGTTFLQLLYWASGHFWGIRNQPVNWIKAQLNAIGWWFGYLVYNPKEFVNTFLRQVSWVMGWFIDDPLGCLRYYVKQVSWYLSYVIDNPLGFVSQFVRQLAWFVGWFLDNPAAFIRYILVNLQPMLDWFIFNPRDFIINIVKQHNADLAQFIDNPTNWLRYRIIGLLSVDWDFLADPVGYIFNKIMTRLYSLVSPRLEQIKEFAVWLILRFI